jgi:proteic killer suppression protein
MSIRTFRHKGLSELWDSDHTAKIDRRLLKRIIERLDALDEAAVPEELNLPGSISIRCEALTRFAIRFTSTVRGA